MRVVIVAVVLIAAVSVGAVVVGRLQRRAAIERALGRDLQPGMPLAAVAAHLRRLEVEGKAVREVRDGVHWYRAV